MIRINIDGRELRGFEGQTIVDIAERNGIFIPTLCHDERVVPYASCGVCCVEVEGMPRLIRACSTLIAEGMVIKTNSERALQSRKAALELLLSDHDGDCRPPCVMACPGKTDCQGYVGLIANGEYKEALKLIKEKLPLPASIGRVCPHPCETACRRKLVEEPVSIAHLKSFAADIDLAGEKYIPHIAPETGKAVAIIGGGPGGLSAAYFLRRLGHQVTVYDAMPQMGGMLRYGIPQYRLPKDIVDQEIAAVEAMGVKMVNGVQIGRDMSLDYIRNRHDAVVVAIGAWESVKLRCPGEDLEGVVGGIDFLREVALNRPMLTGKRIAVVGGGNTAMDAVRTAVRLGAEKVYNIYRRTKAEMPAEAIEIQEAEEEGVIFRNLMNPIEIIGEKGIVRGMRLQIMELGEPDASGRRAPVALEGAEETIEVDTVIVAIGQGLAPSGFEALRKTQKGNIAADKATFQTNIPGVFAIGDATNKGADIAIAAIGEARGCSAVLDSYVKGELAPFTVPVIVERNLTEEDFKDRGKCARRAMPHLPPEERKGNFRQVNLGYTQEEARKEASRCLECGCHDYFECRLIDYVNRYGAKPDRYKGEKHFRSEEDSHPFIHRNPDKCILCGLCARVCDEVMGVGALGLVNRGFDAIVKPALDRPLREAGCISCGQCVTLCPTGALGEKIHGCKQVPVEETSWKSVCGFCGVGCQVNITAKGNTLLRHMPAGSGEALLCAGGRFGFTEFGRQKRITAPMIRREGGFKKTGFEESILEIRKKLLGIVARYGGGAVGVTVSDKLTNEEIYLVKKFAENIGAGKVYSVNKGPSALKTVLGGDSSTGKLEELENAGVILIAGQDIRNSHAVAGIQIKKAVERGAKLIVINPVPSYADEIADYKLSTGNDLNTLKSFAKALLDKGAGKDSAGYENFAASLQGVEVAAPVKAAAEEYYNAKKAMVVFGDKNISYEAAVLLCDIAALRGNIDSPRNGVIRLTQNVNSQGASDLGVLSGGDLLADIENGTIKGLAVFGENFSFNRRPIEFLAVADSVETETTKLADIVLPLTALTESRGSVTSSDGRVGGVDTAVPPQSDKTNVEILQSLSGVKGLREEDVFKAIQAQYPAYRAFPYRKNPEIQIRLVPVSPVEDAFLLAKPGNTNAISSSFKKFMVENAAK